MGRRLNLRQIEAFKAVIEQGTVTRASELLHVSQPAVSKLISHLEGDTDLRLFERRKGRLLPTPRALRLYQEIDRIYTGVQQIENAVELIRRDDQGRLTIGAMPALSGSFIQQATSAFLAVQPKVFCAIQSSSSQSIAEGLASRKLDIGLLIAPIDDPYVIAEPLMAHPVVCILPLDHRLAKKRVIRAKDLVDVPFISHEPESHTSQRVSRGLAAHDVTLNTVMVVNVAPTLCEFVAAGIGVSLVHPLVVSGMRERLAIRRFEPAIELDFHLCRMRDCRNANLVAAFTESTRQVAAAISRTILRRT